MKRLATLILAAPLLLAGCGSTEEPSPSPSPPTTTSATSTAKAPAAITATTEVLATTTVEANTATEVTPEAVQRQIEEAATEGRGPRPPLEEMTRVDGFGYVGIYMTNDGMDNYLCDARGYPSMDIMGDDGCSQPMEWGEVQTAFGESMTRAFEG